MNAWPDRRCCAQCRGTDQEETVRQALSERLRAEAGARQAGVAGCTEVAVEEEDGGCSTDDIDNLEFYSMQDLQMKAQRYSSIL
jgi:hypothetical protein